MTDPAELADRAADVTLSPPERLGKGFFDYQRVRVTLPAGTQTRDVLRAGKVIAVLPLDIERREIVMIRQFRPAAHLANGKGQTIEIVAGRVEAGENVMDAARRECQEEIGVVPRILVELFSYLPTPGLTDEEVTLFVASIDASRVPERTHPTEGEYIRVIRVPVDNALAALAKGTMHNGPLVLALHWLALNRGRVAELLLGTRRV
ncbi:MAG TPA: NUDIX hydrolase [Pseudolabrys sp.]|nr:NUDIX hydrolase [Pseudolabrys sp.]